MKAEALRRLASERVFTTLAVAVAEGVNDHEVGAIAEYALATDFIAGVAFQPMFGSGRSNAIDPMRRATTTGTLRRLGAQTEDRVGPDDFIALPCSHPDCSSITYFIRGDAGEWRSVPRLLGTEQLKGYLGLVSNRIAPDDAMWTALVGMMSETTLVSRPELIDHVLRICEACDLGVTGFVKNLGMWLFDRDRAVEELALRVKRISVKTFMDAWTLNIERLQQCCVHVGSTNGEENPVRIPFCARQLFGGLRRHTSAGMVSARELVQLDERRPIAGREAGVSAVGGDPVGPQTYVRPPLSPPEKYERLAFTFCRMGTVGLIAWALTPGDLRAHRGDRRDRAVRKVDLARRVDWTKCFLRRPTLIIGVWAAIAIADLAWLFVLGGRLPS